MRFISLLTISLLFSLSLEAETPPIYLYSEKSFSLITSESYFVQADSLDAEQLFLIMDRAQVKKFAIYKAGANSIYGKVKVRDVFINIYISPNVINFDRKHFFIKNEDLKWIHDFIEKYSSLLADSTNNENLR